MRFERVKGLLFRIVLCFEKKSKKLTQNVIVATAACIADLTKLMSSTKRTALQHNNLPLFVQTPSHCFCLQLCVRSVTTSRV